MTIKYDKNKFLPAREVPEEGSTHITFKTLGRVDSFHYATSDEICEFVNVPLN
jgi:hypothetical protein